MDLDQARDFVRSNPRAVLATRTTDGIQQSPVLVGVDDDVADGAAAALHVEAPVPSGRRSRRKPPVEHVRVAPADHVEAIGDCVPQHVGALVEPSDLEQGDTE